MLPPPSPVLLILGTDAAGKDYVANFLIRHWQAAVCYLNATVIENDDLDDAAIERELARALDRPAPFPSP